MQIIAECQGDTIYNKDIKEVELPSQWCMFNVRTVTATVLILASSRQVQ